MEIKRAAELLRGLADGRDPITGARLPDESVYNHPEIIRALHCVLQELQTRQTVAQAVNAGRSWRPDEEQQLLEDEEAERIHEEHRIEDLKARCAKKGLDFDTENAKYLAKQAKKAAKKKK